MSSYSSTGADTTTVNLVQTGGFRISNNNTYHTGSKHESPVYVMQSGVYHYAGPGADFQPPNGNANAHTLDSHFVSRTTYSNTDSRNSELGLARYTSRSSKKVDKTGASSGKGISKGETSLGPDEKVARASTDSGASSPVEESSKPFTTEPPSDQLILSARGGAFHSQPNAYGGGDIILEDNEDDTGAPVVAADTRTHYLNFFDALTSREDAEMWLMLLRNRVANMKSADELEQPGPRDSDANSEGAAGRFAEIEVAGEEMK